ncbi:sulfurtransferase [Pigmentiphaga soli]|uniref:Sulfurtransferase n=1 Tax=Pigmentiphaga soli TaxID=1007095 RepID=A0ABP8GC03_9BURK
MPDTPLISPAELQALLRAPGADVLVCDCGFDLADPAAGERAHVLARLPGAVYVHLERDLSAPRSGNNGRHPLPARETFAATMARLGAGNGTRVVAYDAAGGIYAARLWWMLRWAGHAAAAVLDGGLAAWREAGLPLETGVAPPRPAGGFTLRPALAATVDYDTLRARIGDGRHVVIDARAADRFRGENEHMDPVAGHIPGAVNRPCAQNLAGGRFLPAEQLRAAFAGLLDGRPPADAISQCGSGVTACHNLLAMEVAGLPGAALYPGSWSEWCSRPGAPIATGEQ